MQLLNLSRNVHFARLWSIVSSYSLSYFEYAHLASTPTRSAFQLD
jgi:hypothetical protein